MMEMEAGRLEGEGCGKLGAEHLWAGGAGEGGIGDMCPSALYVTLRCLLGTVATGGSCLKMKEAVY